MRRDGVISPYLCLSPRKGDANKLMRHVLYIGLQLMLAVGRVTAIAARGLVAAPDAFAVAMAIAMFPARRIAAIAV